MRLFFASVSALLILAFAPGCIVELPNPTNIHLTGVVLDANGAPVPGYQTRICWFVNEGSSYAEWNCRKVVTNSQGEFREIQINLDPFTTASESSYTGYEIWLELNSESQSPWNDSRRLHGVESDTYNRNTGRLDLYVEYTLPPN